MANRTVSERASCGVDAVSVHPGLKDRDVLDLVRRDHPWVSVYDHRAGDLPGLEAASAAPPPPDGGFHRDAFLGCRDAAGFLSGSACQGHLDLCSGRVRYHEVGVERAPARALAFSFWTPLVALGNCPEWLPWQAQPWTWRFMGKPSTPQMPVSESR